MSRLVYDASILVAWALLCAGAFVQWGLGYGLLVSGVALAAFTVVGVVLTRKS